MHDNCPECGSEAFTVFRDEEVTILACFECGYYIRMEIQEGKVDWDEILEDIWLLCFDWAKTTFPRLTF